MARVLLILISQANADFLTASQPLVTTVLCFSRLHGAFQFFLDRSLLFGNSSNPDIAFFESTFFLVIIYPDKFPPTFNQDVVGVRGFCYLIKIKYQGYSYLLLKVLASSSF